MRTIILALILVNLVSTVLMAMMWKHYHLRYKGMGFWICDMSMQTIGILLIALRGFIPDLISIVFANTISMAGLILGLMGLQAFTGKRTNQIHNFIFLALFAFFHTWFTFKVPEISYRYLNNSLFSLILFAQCSWLMLSAVQKPKRLLTGGTGIVFLAFSAVSAARIIKFFITTETTENYFQAGPIESSVMLIYLILTIILTYSLLLMYSRRLLGDIQSEEEKFSIAFHTAPYALILTRLADGLILEVNEGFENVFGIRKEFARGKTSTGIGLWEHEADRASFARELLLNDSVHEKEIRFRKNDGTYFTTSLSARVIVINSEVCILSSVTDITERKAIENQIRKMNEDLEQIVSERTRLLEDSRQQLLESNSDLESFTYSVSHDLRAPLRAIDGYTTILGEEYAIKLGKEGESIVMSILRNTKKMGNLIDDLLSFSRIGRSTMKISPASMKDIAEAAYNEAVETKELSGINFRLGEIHDISCDPDLMKQVWINLISNAIKFSSREAEINISVSSRAEGEDIVYTITDNGVGFDMKHYHKLFGVFERLHRSDEFEGTGVGLAIVQRIIRRHGGEIWAEAEPGKGAAFSFRLPDIKE